MNEPTVDMDFRPAQYWQIDGAHDFQVSVASVEWNGTRTLYLVARPSNGRIAYDYSCDGDCNGEGEGIVGYVTDDVDTSKPISLGFLADALENYFLAADSLEEALDMAWEAERAGTTDPYDTTGLDADDLEYAYDFAANAYSFDSEYYPQLGVYFEQRVAAWREQKMAQETDKGA